MLQSVIFGFGGLSISEKGITRQKAVLPDEWKTLKITGVGVNKVTFDGK